MNQTTAAAAVPQHIAVIMDGTAALGDDGATGLADQIAAL